MTATPIYSPRIQMFAVWSCLLYIGFLLLGWAFVAGFVPPHLPNADAETIAGIFREDAMRIKIGMIIVNIAAGFLMPFTAILAIYVARIEGCFGVLAICQLLGGMGNFILTFLPTFHWLSAAFRPDAPAEMFQISNDMSWFLFVGGITPTLVLEVSMAVAIFSDRTSPRLFPRWLGYFCLWTAVLALPGYLLFFLKTGPFAWNGLFAFWMPLTVFCSWYLTMFYFMRKVVIRFTRA